MLLSISIKLIMSCRTLLFYARWCGSRSSFGGNSLVNPHEQTRFGGVYYMYKCCICYFNNITHTCTVHQMLVNIGSLPNTPLITRMACHHHLTSPLCSTGGPTCMAVTVAFHLCRSWAALLAPEKLVLISIRSLWMLLHHVILGPAMFLYMCVVGSNPSCGLFCSSHPAIVCMYTALPNLLPVS